MNTIEKTLTEYLKKTAGDTDRLNELTKYLDFLLKKNQELNLISRKLTIETILEDHIYDCLVGVPYFKDFKSISDIGSGGGLPGLILALVFPDKPVTLVEKSPKKSEFLNQAASYIGLKNVTIKNMLVNEHKFESRVITCRAFKDIRTILELTHPYFKHGGKYVLYKGRRQKIDEELQLARKKFKFNEVIHTIDSITDKERHIIELVKA